MNTDATPLDPRPLREVLYDRLLTSLIRGEWGAGERIHDFRIAERFGASRTPVREVLLRLSREGFLVAEPRRGFRVAEMTRAEVDEVYPLILLLEVQALRWSPRCTPEQASRLAAAAGRMRADAHDALAVFEHDATWHDTLLRGANNSRLHATLAELHRVMARYDVAYFTNAEAVLESASEHDAIADAFARHDRRGAVKLLTQHWQRCHASLLEHLTATRGRRQE